MSEYAALGEKLMQNVFNAFENDPLIDYYDFLPIEIPKANTNPVICEQHKLGIQLWAVKVLFSYCYDHLFSWLARHRHSRIKHSGDEKVIRYSQFVVMVVADCMTAWNIRKRYIQDGHLSIPKELKLTELILKKHPKSSEVFFHRKWLLSQLLSVNNSSDCSQIRSASQSKENRVETDGTSSSEQCILQPEMEEQLADELHLCQDAAERYANNYHAWTHRLWVFQHYSSEKLARKELEDTKMFVNRHISDYSAYHYRQMLLNYLSQSASNAHDLLDAELDLCTEFIQRYPGHEAIWVHRRAIVQYLCQWKDCQTDVSYRDAIIQREQEFCDSILHQYKSLSVMQHDQSWQIILANRHMSSVMRMIQNVSTS